MCVLHFCLTILTRASFTVTTLQLAADISNHCIQDQEQMSLYLFILNDAEESCQIQDSSLLRSKYFGKPSIFWHHFISNLPYLRNQCIFVNTNCSSTLFHTGVKRIVWWLAFFDSIFVTLRAAKALKKSQKPFFSGCFSKNNTFTPHSIRVSRYHSSIQVGPVSSEKTGKQQHACLHTVWKMKWALFRHPKIELLENWAPEL